MRQLMKLKFFVKSFKSCTNRPEGMGAACSPVPYVLGGVKMVTGKLGHAWVGAWVLHGCMVVVMWDDVVGD